MIPSLRRSLVLIGLSTLTLGGVDVSAQDALRWKLRSGEILHFSRTQERTTEVPDGENVVRQTTVRTTDLTWVVGRVAPDGTARVTQTIDRLRASTKGSREEVVYDSAQLATPDAAASRLAQGFGPLVGADCSFTLTPRGEIHDLRISDATRRTLQGDPKLARSFNENAFRLLSPAFPLPPGPGTPTWTERGEFPEPIQGTSHFVTTYSSAGTEVREGRTVHKIQVEVATEFPTAATGEGRVRIQAMTGRGTIWFDPAAGRLVRREDQETVTSTMTLGGRTAEQVLRGNTTTVLLPARGGS